eukprot:TRINITY_DN4399_c0_g2_i1.p2 TRINITY_DN4399_c0_g2~~TRINITY_DN4399_c0_g2_i1.p2  ORF type:complete len:267 (+),score=16.01 TRINITY_DN4399_c0_g2_i1:831-1631(+)
MDTNMDSNVNANVDPDVNTDVRPDTDADIRSNAYSNCGTDVAAHTVADSDAHAFPNAAPCDSSSDLYADVYSHISANAVANSMSNDTANTGANTVPDTGTDCCADQHTYTLSNARAYHSSNGCSYSMPHSCPNLAATNTAPNLLTDARADPGSNVMPDALSYISACCHASVVESDHVPRQADAPADREVDVVFWLVAQGRPVEGYGGILPVLGHVHEKVVLGGRSLPRSWPRVQDELEGIPWQVFRALCFRRGRGTCDATTLQLVA